MNDFDKLTDLEIIDKLAEFLGWKKIWVCGYNDYHFFGGPFNSREECDTECFRYQSNLWDKLVPIMRWETSRGTTRMATWNPLEDRNAVAEIIQHVGELDIDWPFFHALFNLVYNLGDPKDTIYPPAFNSWEESMTILRAKPRQICLAALSIKKEKI